MIAATLALTFMPPGQVGADEISEMAAAGFCELGSMETASGYGVTTVTAVDKDGKCSTVAVEMTETGDTNTLFDS